MKKLYVIALMALCFANQFAFAQAKKYPLFEHFSQASCGPCATQNPFFEAIYALNESNMHHITYHTSWPGYDPMYEVNPTESDNMVSYYGVSGVPDMEINGSTIGGPAGVSQEMVDNLTSETSPIRVLVSETTVGSTRNVTIEVQTVGVVDAGTYSLKAAVVEHMVSYASAPGTNGEKNFPDVMREFLASTAGEPFTPAAIGSSVTYSYSYNLDGSWVPEEIYVLAWVQSYTKEVLNSGASFDPNVEVINTTAATFVKSEPTDIDNFIGSVLNIGDVNTSVVLTLTAKQPADWNATFTYDGGAAVATDIPLSAMAGAGSVSPVSISVNVGATAAIGEYTITATFPDDPTLASQKLQYYVISGVTDLIVNNEVAFGDGSAYGVFDFSGLYNDGLASTTCNTFASTSHFTMKKGFENDILGDIKNIYYNVAWTFPALYGDNEKINYLMDFMDNGGNVFICGQDIGWEVNEYAAYDPLALSFYNNYLHANFLSDGTASTTTIYPNTADEWYGTMPTSTIEAVYGSTYLFPDVIESNDAIGLPLFSYNATNTSICGIRSETDVYKAVYLAFGIEMLSDAAVAEQILNLTYIYFNNEIDGIAYNNAIQALLGNAYPNPTNSVATLTLPIFDHTVEMQVSNIEGKVVSTSSIAAGTSSYQLNVESLTAGVYFYNLVDGTKISETKKLIVTK